MKFCNDLIADGMDLMLTLTFQGVQATTLSGTCTPVVPNACVEIPTGTNPTVVLEDDTGYVITEGSFPTATVEAGSEYFLVATVDTASMPTVDLYEFDPLYACSETDPFADALEARSAAFTQDVRYEFQRSVARETRAGLPAYRLRGE
jgi:hypothetical protein